MYKPIIGGKFPSNAYAMPDNNNTNEFNLTWPYFFTIGIGTVTVKQSSSYLEESA